MTQHETLSFHLHFWSKKSCRKAFTLSENSASSEYVYHSASSASSVSASV